MSRFCYIILFCLLFSCHGKKKNELPTATTCEKDTIAIIPDSASIAQKRWNDLAAFISGSSLSPENSFFSQAQSAEWQSYHQRMDSLWAEFEIKTEGIAHWQIQNLPDRVDEVFYPFSGPDVPYLMLFYPNASRYYLLALEPVGSALPSPAGEEIHSLSDTCKIYDCYFNSVSFVLSSGFFRTEDMREDFSGSGTAGVLPILIMFLNRTGNEILSVCPGSFNEKGIYAANETGGQSVEIVFRKRGEKKTKQMFYVSCNLSNRGIGENKPLQALLEKKDAGVFIKSASYLMHNAGFSRIRNTLLENAALLVQDDSGIPYTAFSGRVWDINLYGDYSKPIFLFRRYFQQNLADAYRDSLQITPVDFRFGYDAKSNLLIARKKR